MLIDIILLVFVTALVFLCMYLAYREHKEKEEEKYGLIIKNRSNNSRKSL